VPVEHVVDRRHVVRLDRGPTASFKDFAARFMGRALGRLVRERGQDLVILTATSGDTGSAIAHAFYGVEGIRVAVLFPRREVSDRQRKQMTTIGGNVETLALEAKFDDCQALVKRAFADPDLASTSDGSCRSRSTTSTPPRGSPTSRRERPRSSPSRAATSATWSAACSP
jgi:threonine synthase